MSPVPPFASASPPPTHSASIPFEAWAVRACTPFALQQAPAEAADPAGHKAHRVCTTLRPVGGSGHEAAGNPSPPHALLRDTRLVLVSFDGITPVPRMLLVSEFLLRPDFQVDLDRPLLVEAGDRVSYEGHALVVTRPTGEQRRHPVRDGYWICRRYRPCARYTAPGGGSAAAQQMAPRERGVV